MIESVVALPYVLLPDVIHDCDTYGVEERTHVRKGIYSSAQVINCK